MRKGGAPHIKNKRKAIIMGLSCKKDFGKVQSVFRKLDNEILKQQMEAKKGTDKPKKPSKKADK